MANTIKADEAYRTAVAERGKFFPVDDDYLASIGYPTSGDGKYAVLTYSVNATSISGGTVESTGIIADGVNNTILATVANLTNSNPQATMLVDAQGDQITTFGGSDGTLSDGVDSNIKATVSELTNSNAQVTLLVDDQGDQITSFGSSAIALSGVPTPVLDGANVDPWYDTYGRQVLFGSNMSLNALDVNVINSTATESTGTIADGVDGTILATVSELTNSNAQVTLLVDDQGDQITSFGSSAVAVSGVPTPVLDGANVDPWYDAYGRQVLFGSNMSLNALDVNVINSTSTESTGTIADGVDGTILATVSELTNSNAQVTVLVDANGDQITTFGGSDGTIADGVDSNIKATVAELTNSNAQVTLLVDDQGDQITSFGSSAVAVSGVPTAVLDGENVNPWYDTYGRQVLFGSNMSLNALDVNVVSDSNVTPLGPVTNLNDVVAVVDGASIDISDYKNITVHIISTSVTLGGMVIVESSLDGTNWAEIASYVIDSNIVNELTLDSKAYVYLRTSLTTRSDGTYKTLVYANN